MPPGELRHIAGIAEEVIYTTGDPIIQQGDHGDSMFLIVEGEVRIHQNSSDLATLKEQDYFGEMSILDGEPRSASAAAATDCLLLRINQSDFHDILSSHSDVALAIIRTLSQRLRSAGAPQTPPPPARNSRGEDDR